MEPPAAAPDPCEEEENPPLAQEEPSIWSSLQSSFRSASGSISDSWKSGADSRAKLASSVSSGLQQVKQSAAGLRARGFGRRRPGCAFGIRLSELGGVGPPFLESCRDALCTQITARCDRLMFRPGSSQQAGEACAAAAELQMMADEGEHLELEGVAPLALVSTVVSFLWALPEPLLPAERLLDATAAAILEEGSLSVERMALLWGELRAIGRRAEASCELTPGREAQEEQVLLQVLHQVLAPIKQLKQIDNPEAAHDLCLILAPAIFQLDAKSNVCHGLMLVNAEATLFVLAELV